jgi:hypothetical protein
MGCCASNPGHVHAERASAYSVDADDTEACRADENSDSDDDASAGKLTDLGQFEPERAPRARRRRQEPEGPAAPPNDVQELFASYKQAAESSGRA